MKAPPTVCGPRRWLLLCAAALPLAAAAQTAPPDTATTYKHQLGLTASPVLDGFFKNNRSLPVGLLYKRQIKPNQALRLGVVLSQRNEQRNQSSSLSVNPTFYENSSSLQTYIGQEWQRSLSPRWGAYAGMDIGAGYDRFRRRDASINTINIDGGSALFLRKSDYNFTTYSAFLRPLIAIRYQLKSNLYFTIESVVYARYSHVVFQSDNSITHIDNNTTTYGSANTKDNNVGISLKPINQIALHYCFGSIER